MSVTTIVLAEQQHPRGDGDVERVRPAAVPMVLSKLDELGRLRPGHRVGLMGIGSGLNCTMAEIVW